MKLIFWEKITFKVVPEEAERSSIIYREVKKLLEKKFSSNYSTFFIGKKVSDKKFLKNAEK